MQPLRKPTPPSPKPEPETAPKPKRGRGGGRGHGFQPTTDQRALVVVMAGMGIPEHDMVQAIVNPQTHRPISPMTLRAHFREELDKGFVQANTKVAAQLFKNATTGTDVYPGGIPSAQIFWLKCRMRWQQSPHLAPPPPPPPSKDVDQKDMVRRLAFMLAKRDHEEKKTAAASKPPAPPQKKKLKAPV